MPLRFIPFLIILLTSNALSQVVDKPKPEIKSTHTLKESPITTQPTSKPDKKKFMFLINSDPQMGDEHTKKKGLQTLNELLQMFVDETNARKGKAKADFVVWDGDLVWDAYQNAFDNFQRIVSKMNIPSILVHGNHDGYNDDPKFLNLQEKISGYRKLNYSFDYGKWHFVIIKAEEKYLQPEQKKQMLKWLDNELKNNKDKQTMLFMHYHILPTGLSQMEFYTYFPMSFKNEMLDTITRYSNVKYVFSGHVHIGIKASIKTARQYKGTNFILAPTPVFPRPFGEEFPQFREKGSKYDRRGFYTEIHVNGDDVKIIGRKINHPFKKKYPKKFKSFQTSQDIRAFIPEGKLPVKEQLYNGDFSNDLTGWQSSFRYQKDRKPSFKNFTENGKSKLHYTASYGSWTFDEYLENYQIVKYKKDMHMRINFNTLPVKFKGSGGYFRVFAFDKEGELLKILLFHWGTQENKVKFLQQSWAYNATGKRYGPLWLDKEIEKGNMLSYKLEFNPLSKQQLDIEINQLFKQISANKSDEQIEKISVAYGVWGRVTPKGRKFTSKLNVDSISLSSDDMNEYPTSVSLNGEKLTDTDKALEFGQIYKKQTKK
jgi:3',5'-cyclic AMP phosphodiesterase CpdA